jgi:predicted nuclease of predicted toxin-antitoxin system
MKFIVDAQLPRRLATFLQNSGYDAIHTLDLPQQNKTADSSINALSIKEERIVITKDADFVDSFLTIKQPYKLVLISTGNIKNSDLEVIFATGLSQIVDLLTQYNYIEVDQRNITVHQ